MDRSRKLTKKICIMCYRSPQNILVLACDHTVCLQCAYVTMSHRDSNSCGHEIEFKCEKCHQSTYFDRDLIKQIESSIQPKMNSYQPLRSRHQQTKKQKQPQGVSFIEKMRKQYCSQNPSFRQPISEENTFSQNCDQYLSNKTFNKSAQQKTSFPPNNKKQARQAQCLRQVPSLYKERPDDSLINKSISTKNSKQTKCKIHSYYELIYFCMDCRQVVCSECLLRGQHKEHQNQSISQILQKELPDFINKTSQRFLLQVNKVQEQKQKHLYQVNQKLQQIKQIRHNAASYFAQMKRNIQNQERQVLQKCDQLLQNLKKQETQNEERQKEMQIALSKHIQQIKSLKSFYKEFQSNQNSDTQRKGIEKSLIHKYLSCLKSTSSFFSSKNMHTYQPRQSSFIEQNSYEHKESSTLIKNESQILNQRISEGIKSIRQSLVFQTFSGPNFRKQNRKQTTECQSRITTKMDENKVKNNINKQNAENQYISYISTQNSQNKSKQCKQNSRKQSVSISPYKGQILRSNFAQKKHIIPFKKPINRQIIEREKQNISTQEKSLITEMKTQLSTQNVSAKKCQNSRYQKSRLNSKSKSKNNSITKSKKRNSTSYNGNIVNRFKV